MSNSLNELAEIIHQNAVDKGFYQGTKNFGEQIALIHSEVSEALEADRMDHHAAPGDARKLLEIEDEKQFSDTFLAMVKDSTEDEMADVIIRVLDWAKSKDVDMEAHVLAKMRYNSTREFQHGKAY